MLLQAFDKHSLGGKQVFEWSAWFTATWVSSNVTRAQGDQQNVKKRRKKKLWTHEDRRRRIHQLSHVAGKTCTCVELLGSWLSSSWHQQQRLDVCLEFYDCANDCGHFPYHLTKPDAFALIPKIKLKMKGAPASTPLMKSRPNHELHVTGFCNRTFVVLLLGSLRTFLWGLFRRWRRSNLNR